MRKREDIGKTLDSVGSALSDRLAKIDPEVIRRLSVAMLCQETPTAARPESRHLIFKKMIIVGS